MLSPIINLIQETIGSTRRASDAAETGIFKYSSWYVLTKAALAAGLGLVIVLGALSVSQPASGPNPLSFLVAGEGFEPSTFGL
jgi:hypothetical protein